MRTPTTPPAPIGATDEERADWLASADLQTRRHAIQLLRFAVVLVECIESRGWSIEEFIEHVDHTLEWRVPDKSQVA